MDFAGPGCCRSRLTRAVSGSGIRSGIYLCEKTCAETVSDEILVCVENEVSLVPHFYDGCRLPPEAASPPWIAAFRDRADDCCDLATAAKNSSGVRHNASDAGCGLHGARSIREFDRAEFCAGRCA